MADTCQNRQGGFLCRRCGRRSGFTLPLIDPSGLGLKHRTPTGEPRIYKCEECGTENMITLPNDQWRLIDQGSLIDCPNSVVLASPPIDDMAERDRLEADLVTVRNWSLSAAATAVAVVGLGTAFDPHKRSSTISFALAAVVVVIAIFNSFPLRQSPHPPQKVPQLRWRLTWRHRLLFVIAIGLAATIIATILSHLP